MFEGEWLQGSKMIQANQEINGLDSNDGIISGTGNTDFFYKQPHF